MYPVNLGDQLQASALVPAASITANGNGTGIDLQQYAGQIAIILNSSAGIGNADNTLDVKIQESDDNSSFTDVSGGAFAQVTTVASVQKMSLNKDALKRYIRAVKTVAGTSKQFIASVGLVAMKKYPA